MRIFERESLYGDGMPMEIIFISLGRFEKEP